jgi:protein-tyrosine phosphatase
MIDLHIHILPALDDGAPDMDTGVAMARTSASEGVRTLVATPHVSTRYPVAARDIAVRVGQLNLALARAEVPVAVLPGAEVSASRLDGMTDDEVRALCLGGSDCLLVESPYQREAGFLEEALFGLQVRGIRPMLAHPERSPLFQADIDRLATLVDRGVLCSITTGSLAGRFGRPVRDFALRLVAGGLVHNVASDAHDNGRRPPGLLAGFDAAESELPGIREQARWFTEVLPLAVLRAEELPGRPAPPSPRRRTRLRFVRRRTPR